MINLTNKQARQFMLLKHGLLGEYKFHHKQGVLDFIKQAGCIQFDPVDACGKNAELTLQSRVKGFTKQTLYELLYHDRKLIDYPDKRLSIILLEEWPYFERYRKVARANGLRYAGLSELEDQAKEYVRDRGPVNSSELPVDGTVRWHSAIHWSGNRARKTSASRSVLEHLYSTGEMIIHHKKGARKYYDLAQRHIPGKLLNAADPLPDDFEHQKWRVLRRIGAVGLLWDRSSDALLNIWGLKSPQRNEIFRALRDEGKILQLKVEGIKDVLHFRVEDLPIIQAVLRGDIFKQRCELVAPLDCLMWDRKIVFALFGFNYTWEIYLPADKRKYGFYVLPLLYGDNFVARAEIVADSKTDTLTVKNIWYEDGIEQTRGLSTAISGCITRFAKFNDCSRINFDKGSGFIPT